MARIDLIQTEAASAEVNEIYEKTLRDEDIDFSDSPKLGPDFFANAII